MLRVPVFNLQHPRDFKSTTSRSRTLYIYYFGRLASVGDCVKKHDNQSILFVSAANMAGRRVRPFVRDGEPYLHAWGVFRITYYSVHMVRRPRGSYTVYPLLSLKVATPEINCTLSSLCKKFRLTRDSWQDSARPSRDSPNTSRRFALGARLFCPVGQNPTCCVPAFSGC